MKRLLSLLFLSLSASAFACGGYGDFIPRWSIGVIGAGNYQLHYSGWHPYFLPGVQVKRTTKKFTYRFGVEHVKIYNEPTDMQGYDILYMTGPEKRTVVRAGVEREWFLHRFFSPYVAVDLAAQSMKSNILYEGGIAGLNERKEITTKGIGLMPAVGFITHFGRKVSVFAEYRAEAFINDVYQKSTYYSGNVDTRPTRGTEFDFVVGKIVQAGIQITF